MDWNFLGTDWHLFGKLADVALLTLLFAATVMFFYIQRLRKQPQLPMAEGVRAKQTVLTKVRKRQPMTAEELEYATQVIDKLGLKDKVAGNLKQGELGDAVKDALDPKSRTA